LILKSEDVIIDNQTKIPKKATANRKSRSN